MLSYGEATSGHEVVNGHPVPDALTRAFADSMSPVYQPAGKPFKQALTWGLLLLKVQQPEGGWFAYNDGGTDGFNSVLIVDRQTDTVIFAVADQAKVEIPTLGTRIIRRLALNH